MRRLRHSGDAAHLPRLAITSHHDLPPPVALYTDPGHPYLPAPDSLAPSHVKRVLGLHQTPRIAQFETYTLTIERPNQVWSADIDYIPVQGGFLYLVAIMDWASRRVLAWRLSNTMDTSFCLAALAEA